MEPGLKLVTLDTLQAEVGGAQVYILVGAHSKFKTNLSNLARPCLKIKLQKWLRMMEHLPGTRSS